MPTEDLIREEGMCTTVEEFISQYFNGDDQEVCIVRFNFSHKEASANSA